MDWEFKGLSNKARKTKGTKFYKVRNYIALGIISGSFLFAAFLNYLPFFQKRANLTEDERKNKNEALKKLKLSFPFAVAPRGKESSGD